MNRFAWESNIRNVVPYVAGEQPKSSGVLKLNTNESPYPPAPGVAVAAATLDGDKLKLYPDASIGDLKQGLATYYHLQKEQVFVGVGSDDVLSTAFLTFFNSKKPLLFPDITYAFYEVWASLYQIPFETVPLTEQYTIDPSDYHRVNGGIIFPNPNAPTGIALRVDQVEEIVQANPDVIVIVDEAYIDFGAQSSLSLLPKYDNLLVVGTFSKSRSLAGLRIGFAFGSVALIAYMEAVKNSINSYTVNMPSQILGIKAIEDEAYFRHVCDLVIKVREETRVRLEKMGFHVLDSQCNFLFVTHPNHDAKEMFLALKEAGIYVRHWDKPRISQFLRITIGTAQEMDQLCAFLERMTMN
ncbi:MAG: aminotransferase class I/II-fold pyridoxal phosphate-dependent enzyme [Lachnospiraceae bacterium]|jgi:histidinol-phosphate aminotransferase|nr:aminotransferase class I/II-fold pyridoxal phosphate-dependent enzyme [Lachnospiraceae bacterium]